MAQQQRRPDELKTRQDLLTWFDTIFTSAWHLREGRGAGIPLGNIIPLYGEKTAGMEGFCRLLWGVIPVLAGNKVHTFDLKAIFNVIAEGTDPRHDNYWGDLTDIDQRCVEMSALAVGLILAEHEFRRYLPPPAWDNLISWLKQIRDVQLPENNWSFFPVMVETALCLTGNAFSKQTLDRYFSRLDSYYLGGGWYSDGKARPRDYYNAMAMHFYGLIYSAVMQDHDPQRCAVLRERAAHFAQDFQHMFGADGAAIPFGRSLTYRFAQVAFWSAAAFAGLEGIAMGTLKGLVLRNLRWWSQQAIFDSRGVMTVGYSYSNLLIAEEYNAPGSPYWCCKAFLILMLGEDHPFWQSEELPLPEAAPCRAIPYSGQIIHHDRENHHHYLLNAGQLPGKNYSNSESKYCKFAYSSLLGFNLERSRYGVELNACDSALLLSERDGYYRGRRASRETAVTTDYLYTHWLPWPDVSVKTWLLPLRAGHLRVHYIETLRHLDTVEGGFPLPVPDAPQQRFNPALGCISHQGHGLYSSLVDLSLDNARETEMVIAPPASNILFPYSSGIPVLRKDLPPGQHLIISTVNAGRGIAPPVLVRPGIYLHHGVLTLSTEDKTCHLSL